MLLFMAYFSEKRFFVDSIRASTIAFKKQMFYSNFQQWSFKTLKQQIHFTDRVLQNFIVPEMIPSNLWESKMS